MNDKDLRTIAFLGMHLLVLPLLIGLLTLVNALVGPTRLPPLVKNIIGFLAFGFLYVGMGYAVGAWVAKRTEKKDTDEAEKRSRPY